MAGKGIVGKLGVTVLPDLSQFLPELRRDLNKIKKAVGDLEIRVEAEVVLDEGSLQRVKAQVERLDATVRAKVDVARSDLAKMRRQIEDVDARVEAGVLVDRVSVERAKQEVEKAKPDVRAELSKATIARVRKQLEEIKGRAYVDASVPRKSILKVKKQIDSMTANTEIIPTVSGAALLKAKRQVSDLDARTEIVPMVSRVSILKAAREMRRGLPSRVELTPEVDLPRARRIRLALQRQFDGIHADIKPRVDAIQAARERIQRELDDVKAKITFRDKRQEYKRELETLLSHIRVKLGLDKGSKEKIKKQIDGIEGEATVNANLDKGKAMLGLAALTRPRFVDIHARLDQSSVNKVAAQLAALSGARALNNLRRDLYDFVSHLDETALKLGAVASGVLTLVSSLGTVVGTASQLGLTLARMSPALLALPGMFAGAAVGVGIFVAAVKDAKDALADLGPAFTELQDAISGAFWEEAAQPIRDLVNSALPELRDNIVGIARAYGQWAAEAARVGQGEIGTMDKILGDVREATERATKGVGLFTKGIIRLSSVGSKYLPKLAAQFNRVSESFAEWADKGANDGTIDAAIQRAVEAAKELWRVIRNLGGAIAGFVKGAEKGGFTLERMANGAEKLNRAINSVRGQKVLEDVFAGAAQGMDNLYRHVGRLGPEFERISATARMAFGQAGEAAGLLVSTIAKIGATPEVQRGLGGFFDGVISGFAKLEKVAPQIGELFGSIARFAGTMASVVGGVLAEAFEKLGPSLSRILDALNPVAVALGETLKGAIELVQPWLDSLADWFEKTDPKTIEAIAFAVVGLGLAIKGIGAVQAASGIIQFIAALGPVGAVIAIVVAAVALLAAGFVHLYNNNETFRNSVTTAWDWISEKVGTVVAWLQENIVPAAQAIWDDIFNGLKEVWRWLTEEFAPQFQETWNKIKEIWDRLGKPIFDKVVETLGEVMSEWFIIWNNIKVFFSGVWTAFTALVEGGMKIIRGVIDIVLGLIDGDWKRVWEGIKSVFSGVWTILKGVGEGGMKALWAVIRIVWQFIVNTFKTMVSSVGSITATGFNAVVRIFSNIQVGILNLFRGAGSWLVNAGKSIIRGLINGLKSAIGGVQSTLRGLTSKLPSWKGPPAKDARILTPAGRSIIDGLVDGFEDRIPSVKKTLRGLTGAIAPEVGVDVGVSGGALAAAGGPTVNITNYYPQAQRDSATRDEVAQGIALSGVI